LVTEGIDDETLDSYYAFAFGLEPNRLVFLEDDTVNDRRFFASQVVQSPRNSKFLGLAVCFQYLNSADDLYIFQYKQSEAALLA
jgi:hypothetical protein